jgi:hypothetical protein
LRRNVFGFSLASAVPTKKLFNLHLIPVQLVTNHKLPQAGQNRVSLKLKKPFSLAFAGKFPPGWAGDWIMSLTEGRDSALRCPHRRA